MFLICFRALEGVNLLVSSGTASAIAADRLCLVTRKTARHNDTKVGSCIRHVGNSAVVAVKQIFVLG